MRSRLALLGLFLVLTMTAVWTIHAADSTITVYKTTTCGCCGLWVEHLRKNGFQVVVKEVESTDEYAKKFGDPDTLRSCHTALVDGYTIEGHVPATEIQRLLKERPKAKGLAVPGMPMGSPGMEAGGRSSKYAVLLFQADGKTSVFREYPAK
jgi:hypothetical protein